MFDVWSPGRLVTKDGVLCFCVGVVLDRPGVSFLVFPLSERSCRRRVVGRSRGTLDGRRLVSSLQDLNKSVLRPVPVCVLL